MGDKTTTFGIRVKAETNAETAATSVESLRDSILSSQEAVKQYGSALRNLRGDSAEVVSAKAKLKAAQDAERASISQGVLALGKAGTNLAAMASADKVRASEAAARAKISASQEVARLKVLDAARAKAKKKREEEEAAATLKEKSTLSARFSAWVADSKKRVAGEEGASSAISTAMGVTKAAATALAGAFLAVNAAVLAGAVATAKWVIEDANMLRTMNLVNEAALQNASNALHMGHQIDALGEKVSFTRAELQGMQLDISRSLAGTQANKGNTILDTFNAVAQISDAMGNSAGKVIDNIIERGKHIGRIGIGIRELQGTGLTFEGVAEELGKSLKGGIAEARQQLFMGRVDIDKGALALKLAAEKRFASLNLRKMLDINVIGKKFRDTLATLTSGVDLTPLLTGLQSLSKMFGLNTATGQALKELLTGFGNGLVKSFEKALPFIKVFFTELLIGGYRLAVVWLDVRDKVASVLDLKVADVTLGTKAAFLALGDAVKAAGDAVIFLVEAYRVFNGTLVTAIPRGVSKADWEKAGADAAAGAVRGMQAQAPAVSAAARGMGDGAKNAFRASIDAHSPSVVFQGFGKNMGQGAVKGIDESRDSVQAATDRMAPTVPAIPVAPIVPAPQVPDLSAATQSKETPQGPVTVNVTLEFPNATDGPSVQQTLTGADFQAKLTQVLERIARSRGVPTQKAAV